MKLKPVAAAILAVIATPLLIQGAEGQTPPTEKRTCDVNVPTGSRLGGVRRCRTKAERDAARAESKQTVERIQSQKNFTEQMIGMQCRGSRAC